MPEHDATTPWTAVDEADAEGFRSYLDTVGDVDRIAALKRRSADVLEPEAGDRLLDVGCGTGDDARALAERVGPSGLVVGVDRSRAMIETARARSRGGSDDPESGATAFCVADATRIPVPDNAVDGARTDRVLQHLSQPQQGFEELVRVTRPGGRVVAIDSDWGTLTLAAGEHRLDDRLTDPDWSCANTGDVGRRLQGWAATAGLRQLELRPTTLTFTEFEAADSVLGLTGRTERLEAANEVSPQTISEWLTTFREATDSGTFFASLTLFTVSGTVPDSHRSSQ